jgi:ribokinase
MGKHRDVANTPDVTVVGQVARDLLLACADVVRAAAREAELLLGHPINEPDEAPRAAHELAKRGPGLVALPVGDHGNVFVWPDGSVVLPLADVPAALTMVLVRGGEPRAAGGRPQLTPEILEGRT